MIPTLSNSPHTLDQNEAIEVTDLSIKEFKSLVIELIEIQTHIQNYTGREDAFGKNEKLSELLSPLSGLLEEANKQTLRIKLYKIIKRYVSHQKKIHTENFQGDFDTSQLCYLLEQTEKHLAGIEQIVSDLDLRIKHASTKMSQKQKAQIFPDWNSKYKQCLLLLGKVYQTPPHNDSFSFGRQELLHAVNDLNEELMRFLEEFQDPSYTIEQLTHFLQIPIMALEAYQFLQKFNQEIQSILKENNCYLSEEILIKVNEKLRDLDGEDIKKD